MIDTVEIETTPSPYRAAGFTWPIHALEAWAARVSYKDWTIEVGQSTVGCYYLRVRFNDGGKIWTGRRWLLSPEMTESEVIQTALKAVLAAEEHEARERFLYLGRPVFGPHIAVGALYAACLDTDERGQL